MELIEKLKKQLSEEYGIHSDQELMDAIAHQKPIDIGVFVKEVNGIEKASSSISYACDCGDHADRRMQAGICRERI